MIRRWNEHQRTWYWPTYFAENVQLLDQRVNRCNWERGHDISRWLHPCVGYLREYTCWWNYRLQYNIVDYVGFNWCRIVHQPLKTLSSFTDMPLTGIYIYIYIYIYISMWSDSPPMCIYIYIYMYSISTSSVLKKHYHRSPWWHSPAIPNGYDCEIILSEGNMT